MYCLLKRLLGKFSIFQVVKELQVTMFQALVLLLFNDKVEWTYEDIQLATKIGRFIFFLDRLVFSVFHFIAVRSETLKSDEGRGLFLFFRMLCNALQRTGMIFLVLSRAVRCHNRLR